ncbi:hypothetical protein H696_04827 [Fonticula alba]|uniref:Gamma-secretase-activating protein C-terminal domain-containing protein n=1 Tax=Fonticula alba TaxID=691883 RepID=A0A058Z2R7_FONAL|nr:hypothetical protein H696_04827 [Fonticula alba]KCV68535.1 hypothetical protein H696_04827 [Fonticula alba]|eukprot:XP_009496967.1 hypothetical protein H696_04827 [Fonticula alba]
MLRLEHVFRLGHELRLFSAASPGPILSLHAPVDPSRGSGAFSLPRSSLSEEARLSASAPPPELPGGLPPGRLSASEGGARARHWGLRLVGQERGDILLYTCDGLFLPNQKTFGTILFSYNIKQSRSTLMYLSWTPINIVNATQSHDESIFGFVTFQQGPHPEKGDDGTLLDQYTSYLGTPGGALHRMYSSDTYQRLVMIDHRRNEDDKPRYCFLRLMQSGATLMISAVVQRFKSTPDRLNQVNILDREQVISQPAIWSQWDISRQLLYYITFSSTTMNALVLYILEFLSDPGSPTQVLRRIMLPPAMSHSIIQHANAPPHIGTAGPRFATPGAHPIPRTPELDFLLMSASRGAVSRNQIECVLLSNGALALCHHGAPCEVTRQLRVSVFIMSALEINHSVDEPEDYPSEQDEAEVMSSSVGRFLECVVPLSVVDPAQAPLARLCFTTFNNLLIIYLPGIYIGMVDCSIPMQPRTSLAFTGPALATCLPFQQPAAQKAALPFVTQFEVIPNDLTGCNSIYDCKTGTAYRFSLDPTTIRSLFTARLLGSAVDRMSADPSHTHPGYTPSNGFPCFTGAYFSFQLELLKSDPSLSAAEATVDAASRCIPSTTVPVWPRPGMDGLLPAAGASSLLRGRPTNRSPSPAIGPGPAAGLQHETVIPRGSTASGGFIGDLFPRSPVLQSSADQAPSGVNLRLSSHSHGHGGGTSTSPAVFRSSVSSGRSHSSLDLASMSRPASPVAPMVTGRLPRLSLHAVDPDVGGGSSATEASSPTSSMRSSNSSLAGSAHPPGASGLGMAGVLPVFAPLAPGAVALTPASSYLPSYYGLPHLAQAAVVSSFGSPAAAASAAFASAGAGRPGRKSQRSAKQQAPVHFSPEPFCFDRLFPPGKLLAASPQSLQSGTRGLSCFVGPTPAVRAILGPAGEKAFQPVQMSGRPLMPVPRAPVAGPSTDGRPAPMTAPGSLPAPPAPVTVPPVEAALAADSGHQQGPMRRFLQRILTSSDSPPSSPKKEADHVPAAAHTPPPQAQPQPQPHLQHASPPNDPAHPRLGTAQPDGPPAGGVSLAMRPPLAAADLAGPYTAAAAVMHNDPTKCYYDHIIAHHFGSCYPKLHRSIVDDWAHRYTRCLFTQLNNLWSLIVDLFGLNHFDLLDHPLPLVWTDAKSPAELGRLNQLTAAFNLLSEFRETYHSLHCAPPEGFEDCFSLLGFYVLPRLVFNQMLEQGVIRISEDVTRHITLHILTERRAERQLLLRGADAATLVRQPDLYRSITAVADRAGREISNLSLLLIRRIPSPGLVLHILRQLANAGGGGPTAGSGPGSDLAYPPGAGMSDVASLICEISVSSILTQLQFISLLYRHRYQNQIHHQAQAQAHTQGGLLRTSSGTAPGVGVGGQDAPLGIPRPLYGSGAAVAAAPAALHQLPPEVLNELLLADDGLSSAEAALGQDFQPLDTSDIEEDDYALVAGTQAPSHSFAPMAYFLVYLFRQASRLAQAQAVDPSLQPRPSLAMAGSRGGGTPSDPVADVHFLAAVYRYAFKH